MKRFSLWLWDAMIRGGWAPATVFAAHVIASLGFDAYSRFPRLDIPMHFIGGMAISYFFHRASIAASARGIIGPFHAVTHGVLVFALTCTTAVFWEFAEFITDRFFRTQAQLGLQDTLGDMFLGISGGMTALVIIAIVSRRRSDSRFR